MSVSVVTRSHSDHHFNSHKQCSGFIIIVWTLVRFLSPKKPLSVIYFLVSGWRSLKMRLLKSRKKTRSLVSIWGSPQGGHHATTTTSGGSSARARSTVSSGGSLAQIIINSFSVISSSLLIFLALLPTLGKMKIISKKKWYRWISWYF